jgi:hypothetical protein
MLVCVLQKIILFLEITINLASSRHKREIKIVVLLTAKTFNLKMNGTVA